MSLRVGYDGCLVRPRTFGVDQCIVQLARALVRGTDVQLVLYSRDLDLWGAEIGAYCPSRIDHVTLPACARFRGSRIAWQQFSLPTRVTTDAIDVFHATAYTMPLAMKVPTVLTVFDCLAFEQPELCKLATRWHYRGMMPASIRRASRVIVPSNAVSRELRARFQLDEDKIEVISPGVDRRYLTPPDIEQLEAVRARYQLPDHFVLFVGNIEPKKNLDRLISGFIRASASGLKGDLVIVGGFGFGREDLRRKTHPRVRVLGYVPDEHLPSLYRLSSEFAFPSLAEGFGLPVIEAMACGVPVVASRVPAIVDGNLDAAVLIDPLSVDSIAAGLFDARHDSNLRSKVRRLGSEVAAKFSWDRASSRTLELYEQVSENERHT